MEILAKVTSKGQITLPKELRDALGIGTGDRVHFRVERDRAVLAKTPEFLELAGSVEVPPELRGARWKDIRSRTQRAWAEAASRR